ncbi:hypothetical protein [Streptomyces sp. NPDC051642]|uniref:hypothetical protein n=1 Tax=unclassified Streptomyces TaxID=2593676 RepID=UPI003414185D
MTQSIAVVSELRTALRVNVALIRPAIAMCTLVTVLAALQLFNEPNTLQPLSNAISLTRVPLMKIYTDAFVDSDINLAAATSVVLAAGILAALTTPEGTTYAVAFDPRNGPSPPPAPPPRHNSGPWTPRPSPASSVPPGDPLTKAERAEYVGASGPARACGALPDHGRSARRGWTVGIVLGHIV